MPQAQVQNRICLEFTEFETLHQCPFRLVLCPDNLDHLVNIEISDHQTFKDMQAVQDLIEPELQSTQHGILSEFQPFIQQIQQRPDSWFAINTDHVEVNAIGPLQVSCRKEVRHNLVNIDSVGFRHYHDPGRVFMVGLIAQIDNHWQFFALHLGRNLFQHFCPRHLVRQCGDDNVPIFPSVDGSCSDSPAPRLINLLNVVRRGDDFCTGWEIRSFDVIHHIPQGRFRFIQQTDAGADHLVEVVRQDISRHTYRNATATIQQDIR